MLARNDMLLNDVTEQPLSGDTREILTALKSSNFCRQDSQYPGFMPSSRLGGLKDILFAFFKFNPFLVGSVAGGSIVPRRLPSGLLAIVTFFEVNIWRFIAVSIAKGRWPVLNPPAVEVVPVVEVIPTLLPEAAM